MQNQLFEAALGIAKPWYVRGVDFDPLRKVLTIGTDFVAGSRFAAAGVEGLHRVHDTRTKQATDPCRRCRRKQGRVRDSIEPDFEKAIRFGTTHVRIGTAILGARGGSR
jgi:hypothetical protein